MTVDGFAYIENPGMCDDCHDLELMRDHKTCWGCVVDWDGELDGLMSLEDDEPQERNGQGLLFM